MEADNPNRYKPASIELQEMFDTFLKGYPLFGDVNDYESLNFTRATEKIISNRENVYYYDKSNLKKVRRYQSLFPTRNGFYRYDLHLGEVGWMYFAKVYNKRMALYETVIDLEKFIGTRLSIEEKSNDLVTVAPRSGFKAGEKYFYMYITIYDLENHREYAGYTNVKIKLLDCTKGVQKYINSKK